MGLGLYIGAENKPRGMLRRRRAPERLLEELVAAIKQELADPILNRLCRHQIKGLEASVQFHPAEEPVDFLFQDSWLVCSAKTSSAGPGYHEFLIELLERAAGRCELEWVFIDYVPEFCDETDFALQRDRQALRMAMARQLLNVGQHLLNKADLKQVGLSMPIELRVAGDYFAVSPLGFWQRDWFEMLVGKTGDELVNQASQFFPWWEAGLNGEFYRRCGLVKCWMDLRWRPPRNQEERDDIDLTLECFERARILPGSAPVPNETTSELKRLLAESNQNQEHIPQRGIGFRRGKIVWGATGTWTIEQIRPGVGRGGLQFCILSGAR
jgi:hypothetical protein